MMDKRTTLVLSVIAVSLLAFILLVDRGTLSTSEVARRGGHVLARFVRDRVTRVELVRGEEPPVVFEREPTEEEGALGDFRIVAPVEARADQDAVESFLGALEWLMPERTLNGVTDEDRRRYGLREPRFVVRFRVGEEGGALRVGGEAPEGQGIYVGLEGEDRAYVVGSDIVESIDHDLAHFRDKELFATDFFSADAESVRLAQDGDAMLFEKQDRSWHVREPVQGWANAAALDRLLRVTRDAHAARFVAEGARDLARYGLETPSRELTVTRPADARGTRVARLRVGHACAEHEGERYAIAGDEGPIVCVLASELTALELAAEDARETRLVGLGADAIERIVLEGGPERVELAREESGWQLTAGEGDPRPADEPAVAEWLRLLREQRAQAFEPMEGDTPAHGLAAPSVTLTLRQADSDEPVVIRLGEVADGAAWVRRGEEPAAVRFESAVAELLRASALRFRDRALVGEPPTRAEHVRVRRDGVEERAVRGEGGAWSLEAPLETDADRVLLRELVRQLGALRAERFVAARPQPEHSLADPRITVSVRFEAEEAEGEPRTVTLRVGAPTSEGAYAQLAGDDAVFEIGRPVLEALDEPLASLDLLTIETETARSIRIERAGEVVADLTLQGTSWQSADGAPADAERTSAFLERLSTLRAESVLRYGPADASLGLAPPATRVTITLEAGPISIDLGDDQGTGEQAFVPGRRSGLDIVYRLRPDLVQVLRTYAP